MYKFNLYITLYNLNPKNLGQKFWIQKNSELKKKIGPTNILVKTSFVLKNVGPQNVWPPKKFVQSQVNNSRDIAAKNWVPKIGEHQVSSS